jgi:hypothetical protein
VSFWVIQAETECLCGYLLLSLENASLTLRISVFSRTFKNEIESRPTSSWGSRVKYVGLGVMKLTDWRNMLMLEQNF